MHRYFEIIKDGAATGPKKYDLPLAVGGSEASIIRLEGVDHDVCYIGEDHGHLFLQPVSDSVEIFHNRERVRASVWIKSGDVTRIGNEAIVFDISGDVVTIRVVSAEKDDHKLQAEAPEPPGESPPSLNSLPRVSADYSGHQESHRPFVTKIAFFLLPLLLACALVIIFARPFYLNISPVPDSISFSGPFPVIEISGRYVGLPFRYGVKAQKEGYEPLNAVIDLGENRKEFTLSMIPLPGVVDFTSEPVNGADIKIDGASVGVTPVKGLEVPAGRHKVRASLEKYRDAEQEIIVQGKGVHQSFQLRLEPAWGYLNVISEPSGAKILVDGQELGMHTPALLEIAEGTHHVLLSHPGYLPCTFKVSISSGEHKNLNEIKLKPVPATLEITGEPEGALVAIDGVFVGKLPLEKEVEAGKTHEITVTAPGFASQGSSVLVKSGVRQNIEFKLKPVYGTIFVRTEPERAELFIDGRKQARNGGKFRLRAMPHVIEARADGYVTASRKINLLQGGVQTVSLRLKTFAAAKREKALKKSSAFAGKMILITPRPFMMGSSRREQGRRTNEVLRKVELSRPFFIGAYEVTNGEFRRFKSGHSSGSFSGHTLDGDKQPVVNVTWEDAARYCNFLSGKQGLPLFYRDDGKTITVSQPPNTGYRLPTEAEWAYAARIEGNTSPAKYPWPGGYPPKDKSGNFADESARGMLAVIIDGYHDGYAVSAPPGSFSPNRPGLFDIGGNVSEWCHDFYSPAYSSQNNDPLGPESGTHHVIRGSSWQDSSITELRLSYRTFGSKATDFVGFRIARYAELK